MTPASTTEKTLAIIMGGGAGTRLFPLTKERSKPAVPLAGKYRLVDIPISNCINSGLRRIYVLTQFNSTSLHRHIHCDLPVRPVLALLRRDPRRAADARRTRTGIRAPPMPCGRTCATSSSSRYEYYVILSRRSALPDGLPRDARAAHRDRSASSRIATIPVSAHGCAPASASCTPTPTRKIIRFEEKPKDPGAARRAAHPRGAARGARPARRRRPLPGLDGHLRLQPRDARSTRSTTRTSTSANTSSPSIIHERPRDGLHLPGLLGGHRHDPLLLRGQSHAHGPGPALQFLRHRSADLHARPLPAREQDQRRHDPQAIISDGCVISDALDRARRHRRPLATSDSGTTIRNTIVMGADFYEVDSARGARASRPSASAKTA